MMRILTERGYSSTTTADRGVVRDLKEKLCYTPLHSEEKMASAASTYFVDKTFALPDEKLIPVRDERLRCPEAFFQPLLHGLETTGIHKIASNSIIKSNVDIRKDLCANMISTEGNALFPGLADRLHIEMITLFSRPMEIRILASPDREHSVWIGGSVLAYLSSFQKMWITRQEYYEGRPSIVHQKCF
uniref:Actin n=1 Tax=Angiostrongylus cantonensis TaxID=6313 RepID=A0A0K0DPQ2_ANGCA